MGDRQAIYSPYILVPKQDLTRTTIFNLRYLNKFVRTHFKITLQEVIPLSRRIAYMAKFDLKDSYFHMQ